MNRSLFYNSYRRLLFGASHSVRRYALYVIMAFSIMMMSWEAAAADAAIAGQAIPEQSIRLRILANSDSPADQLLKRKVRDAVIEQINAWVSEPDNLDQARRVIHANIPAIEQVVQDTMKLYGYDYPSTVELGLVDFPTKLYGNQVYPAGEYEALRISIGEAEGQNWWCVLFPPLCFVDMASGAGEPVALASEAGAADKDDVQAASAEEAKPVSEQEKEARFFLWDMLQKLLSWFDSLFEAETDA